MKEGVLVKVTRFDVGFSIALALLFVFFLGLGLGMVGEVWAAAAPCATP